MSNRTHDNHAFLAKTLEAIVGAREFSIEPIGSGDGFMADVSRIRWSSRNDEGSLILKTASSDPVRRQLAERYRSYTRESMFYLSLSEKVPIRTPKCYFNHEQDYLLLLEDLVDWPPASTATGATLAEARTAVQALARLHASPTDVHVFPIETFEPNFIAATKDMETFVTDRLQELPPSQAVELMHQYASSSLQFLRLFTAQPQMFSHMDYRLDNMRIDGDDLVLFDWSEYSLAPPGIDLANFMVTSVPVRNRQAWEEPLLRAYLQAFTRQGGTCTFEALMDSYRIAIPPSFYLAALVLTRGHREYGELLATRCLDAITSHLPFLSRTFGLTR